MDAMMIALIATAAAAFGGRWWQLASAALARLTPAAGGWAIGSGVLLVAGAAAWLGAGLTVLFGSGAAGADGRQLFLAVALQSASAALAWPLRAPSPSQVAAMRAPGSAAIVIAAALFGDSAPFLISAVATRAGGAAFAALGGMAGLAVAVAGAGLPRLRALPRCRVERVRRLIAVVLGVLALAMAADAIVG